jgi:hypothetical protein
MHRFRHSTVHWRIGQRTLARFQYSDLIRNARFFAEAYNVDDFARIGDGEANSSAALEEYDDGSATVLVHSTARLDDAEELFRINAFGPAADDGERGDSARTTLLTLLLKRDGAGDVGAAAALADEIVQRVAARREPAVWRTGDFGCDEWRSAYTAVGRHIARVDPCVVIGAALVRAGADTTIAAPYLRAALPVRVAELESAFEAGNITQSLALTANALDVAGRGADATLLRAPL